MPAEAGALRMARHAMRRVGVVEALLHRLATIPEAIEMARATGLTIGQVGLRLQIMLFVIPWPSLQRLWRWAVPLAYQWLGKPPAAVENT